MRLGKKRKHVLEKYFTESDRLKEIIHEMEGMACSFIQTKDHVPKKRKKEKQNHNQSGTGHDVGDN